MSQRQDGGLKNWAEWLLFFSSYSPLYIIIIAKTHDVQYEIFGVKTPLYNVFGTSVSAIALLAGFFGTGVLLTLFTIVYFKRTENGQPKPIESYEEKNDLMITYILVHVVPFAFIEYSELLPAVAFLILFLSIGVIQVRSNYLYVNPVLALWKYDVYKIEDAELGAQLLLTKSSNPPRTGESSVTAVELSNGVYISTSA